MSILQSILSLEKVFSPKFDRAEYDEVYEEADNLIACEFLKIKQEQEKENSEN
jgi:hypothetical protein